MGSGLSREELIRLVQRIMDGDGTEDGLDQIMDLLEANVPDPNVSDLIFWPSGFPHDPNALEATAEQVVDKALAYKPIALP